MTTKLAASLAAIATALVAFFIASYIMTLEGIRHSAELVDLRTNLTTQCNERITRSDEMCKASKQQQLDACGRAAAMSQRVQRATCGNLADQVRSPVSNGSSDNTRYRLLGADGQFLVQLSRFCSDDSQPKR